MSPEVRRRRRTRGFRRLRHIGRERPVLPVVGVLCLLVVVGVAWAAWRVFTVAQDLDDVDRNARILRAALVRGDVDGAQIALRSYQEAAEEAESGTGGPVWRAFEWLPVFGDDAEGVRVAATALAGIGREGLPPLVSAADDVTARSFHPEGQVFPLERIATLEEPAQRSEVAFARAEEALAAADPEDFYGPVRLRYEALEALVSDARSTLGSAYRAARLMPSFLGAEQPRSYLLVMQNNAEIRSSGGLPGSVSVVHAEDGRVEIVEQIDMAELEGTPEPILPLGPEEEQLFGEELGRWGVNATLTPDFVRAADLVRARWEQQVGGTVDGIFFVDPVAVSYLLRATGPVDVPGYGAVTGANVVRRVENDVYITSRRPAVHSAYQNAVAKAVFNAFSGGRGEPVEVIRGLAAAVEEGRIRMHSFVEEDQAVIAGTAIAGEFPSEAGESPHVGIYLNDGGETKMSYYLRYEATFTTRSCTGGVQDIVGSIQFTNDTPPAVDALPPTIVGYERERRRVEDGQQYVVAYLMSPVDGEIVELDLGTGRAREPAVQSFRNREVATLGILLDPEESRTVEYVVRSGRGQTGAAELFVTPGATPGTQSTSARSAC